MDQSISKQVVVVDPYQNSCEFLQGQYSVDMDDLLEWNPSLSSNKSECALQEGFSYCVLKDEDSEKCRQ